jgi:hypothetical protein
MARIARTDQVLLLLRERLQRGGVVSVRQAGQPASPALSPIERARALAVMAALDADGRRKLLVRVLLGDRLGERITNDAAFQAISDRVLAMLDDLPEGRALIDAALADLDGA